MSDNIKVVVKVRPLIARELEEKLSYNWSVKDNTLFQIDKNGKLLKDNLQQYTFDKVYDKDSDTIALYNDIVKPIVAASLKGINGTIFAYGQTSSGKTYTMSGTEDVPGITQLAVHDLFEMIKNIPERDFLLRVSYIELYNETINDLLDVNKTNIKVHDTLQGTTKVDCTEKVTSTPAEMFDLMKEGEANRQIGTTNMNEKSSRSHSIFQIIIESREHSEEGGEEGCVCVSQLNLVDLAGSERGGQSGATGKCLKESTHINKSLSTLALVIKQLSEESGCFTNYRDSKLTRILQNSLGGNANTSIICAVTPASTDETISTLQFATRAKIVKNKPKVNEVHTSASMIQTLTKELAKMRSKLESAQNIKRDNILLRNKIEQLQRKILNGPRSATQSDRRKTWCAPRRATICTLQPVPEHSISLAKLSHFIPIKDSLGPSDQVTVTVNDEVIEIDSDEEIPSVPTDQPCSPYHRCKESSKTPPCVLREKVRTAEEAYNDVVEMTKLEKICLPSVVELEHQIQTNTNTITMLEDKVKILSDECKNKDNMISLLNSKLEKKSYEYEQIILARDELKKNNESYDTTVAELEFSYDTLKKKSKTREEELLLMLKEKENHYKPKPTDTAVNFMDLSKDITLVNSDFENSIIDNHDKTENIEAELRNKILLVKEFENKIIEYEKQLSNLEIANKDLMSMCNNMNDKVLEFEKENNVLKSTVNTLNNTIKRQNESIHNIENDIDSYNNVIHQLQLQLNLKEIKPDNTTIKSFLNIEDKIINNNENLNKFVTGFKQLIDLKDIEITELKQIINTFNNYKDTNIEYKVKFEEALNEIRIRDTDLKELKDKFLESENKITDLSSQNKKITIRETEIRKEYDVIDENNKYLKSKIAEKDKEIHDYRNDFENLIMLYTEKENDLINNNNNLSEQILELNRVIESLRNENDTELKQIINTFNNYKDTNIEYKVKFEEALNEIRIRDTDLKELKDKFLESENKITDLSSQNKKITIRETEIRKEYDVIDENNKYLKSKIAEKDKEIHDYRNDFENLIMLYTEKENDLINNNNNLSEQILELNRVIESLRNENDDKDAKLIEPSPKPDFILQFNMLKNKCKDILLKISNDCSLLPNTSDKDDFEIINIFLTEIDIIITKEISERNKIIVDNEELKKNIDILSHQTNYLIKVDEKRVQEIDTLTQQCELLNIELSDIKSIVETKSQENVDIHNQLNNKSLIISMLVDKDNKINEEIDKINSLINLKDEKYQEIKLKLEKSTSLIKNIHFKFRVKCDLLQETVEQSHVLQKNLEQKNKIISCAYEKLLNFKKLHYMSSNEKATDFDDLPNLIDECIKKTIEIQQYTRQNEFTAEEFLNLKNINNLLEERLAKLSEENFTFSTTIENLKKEIIFKKDEFNHLCDITNNLKLDLQIIYNENEKNKKYCQKLECDVILLNNKLHDSKNKLLEIYTKETIPKSVQTRINTPMSLLTICQNKINEIFSYEPQIESKIKLDNFKTNLCNCVILKKDIETLQNENLSLKTELNELVNNNKILYTDLEQSKEDTKSLIDVSQELEKIILNHRTNLTTLIATNYAENNLLKFKIKAHQHHHSRLHNVCERDIPGMKRQLLQLYTILQNGPTDLDFNNSIKRFSRPNAIPGNTSNENKNESNMTLDGDLLMLDTNITMTTDNTSTVYDETSFDVTQINIENISSLIQENVADKNTNFDVINKDENLDSTLIGCENCKFLTELKADIQIKEKEIEAFQQNLEKQEENHAQCEILKFKIQEYENKIKEMSDQIIETQQLKIEFENKFKNVASELSSSKDLLRKAKNFENDIVSKSKEIDLLKKKNDIKNEELKKLQDENITMSDKLMDYVTDIDTLKKELDDIKLHQNEDKEKVFENKTCSSCEVKDKLLQSIKKDFSPKESANSSSHDIYCLLQSEINASQEDCKGIAKEVATIKYQIERNNSPLKQQTDFNNDLCDESIRKFSVTDNNNYKLEIKQMQDNATDFYTTEKKECLEFIMQKTGEDNIKLDKNIQIKEILKILYDYLVNKHCTEIENLTNKLTNIQDSNNNYQLKINEYILKNNEICKEIQDKELVINKFNKVIKNILFNVGTIKETISNHTENKFSSDISNLFKHSLLSIIDEGFNLVTVPVYDLIISNITSKNKEEIDKLITQCNAEQEKVNNVLKELNTVKEELNQEKMQFSKIESEYKLLKSREEKLKEICNGVTLDLIERENKLKDVINEGMKTLLSDDYIKTIDLKSFSAMDSINILFKYLSEKYKFDVHNSKQILTENQQLIEQMKSTTNTLQEKEERLLSLQQSLDNEHNIIETLNSEILEKNKQLSEQKFAYEKTIVDFETKLQDLNTIIIKNLNDKVESLHKTNVKYEDVINKLNEQVSVIQTKLQSETEKKNDDFLSKVKALEFENCMLKESNCVIIKEKDNLYRELQDAGLLLKHKEVELTKLSNELSTLKESLVEKSTLIQQLKSEAESLLENNELIMTQNKELIEKVREREQEITQLQLNTKTLEKSAEIQNNIIKRIQKEKEEQVLIIAKKDESMQQLSNELSALRQSYDSAADVKEARLEADHIAKHEPKRQSGLKTEDFVARSRERRQSIYDANRSLSNSNHEDFEAVFATNNDLGDLFSVKREAASVSSTSNSLTRSRAAEKDELEEPDSTVSLSRRRRQSIHDLHRPALRDSLNNTRNDDKDSNDSLRRELESCRKELDELRERCRELDEECETCGQYLAERDEQCYSLNAAKLALQARVEEMTEQLKLYSSRDKRDVVTAHVAVNTDEDWSQLHTVFVERMSFDREVDRNKQLTRALEEFHHKNRELKAAVSSLERKLLRETNAPEVTKLRQELEKSKKHLEQLSVRCQEVDSLRTHCDNLQGHIKELTGTIENYKRNQDSGDRREDDKKSLEIAALKKQLEAVSKERERVPYAGSAIVMSQQVSDVMRENQKLIRTNTKLMNLCKRRGLRSDDDRENQLPN